MVILLPLVFAVVFVSVQAGLWFYGRSVALAAAEEGARVSAARGSSLPAGITAARQFASAAGGSSLHSVTTTGTRSTTFTTVSVTGTSVRLIPWLPMDLMITQSATMPVERLT